MWPRRSMGLCRTNGSLTQRIRSTRKNSRVGDSLMSPLNVFRHSAGTSRAWAILTGAGPIFRALSDVLVPIIWPAVANGGVSVRRYRQLHVDLLWISKMAEQPLGLPSRLALGGPSPQGG
jgi:hypothetical protein